MSFGQRLKQARKNAKLTQEQVAKKLGLDYSTISKYENNHSEPDNETLARMADMYNVKVGYLITGRTDDNSPSDKKENLVDDNDPRMGLAFITGGEDLSDEEAEYLKESLELFRRMRERKAKEREGK